MKNVDEMENYDLDVDVVEEEDDEEIDEEEAFDENDEEQFGSFFGGETGSRSKGKKKPSAGDDDEEEDDLMMDILDESEPKKKPKKSQQDDEDYDDEEDEDLDGLDDEDDGAFVNLSDMLGASEPPSSKPKSKPEATKKEKSTLKSSSKVLDEPFSKISKSLMPTRDDDEFGEGDDEELLDDEDEEDMEEQEDQAYDSLDEDDKDEAGLVDFVSKLPTRSGTKKRKLAEITEAYEESEFNLAARRSGSDSNKNKKISLTDMVSGLSSSSTFSSLRKQLDDFKSSELPARGQKIASGVEAVPLANVVQERVGRVAAYAEAKKEVTKWQSVVKKNREAEQLVFPMNQKPVVNDSSSALVGKFQAETSLEQEIANILEDSALTEKRQMELEEMELNKVTKEELEARRAELAKLRSLMFYQELKQKKIAKIKSKTYRKVHRKKKGKNGEEEEELSVAELAGLDPDLARDKLEKLEVARIKERMTMKHKNTGKWAQRMLKRSGGDEETRQALMEQLSKNHALTRKIAGLESDEDEDDLDIDDEDLDADLDPAEAEAAARSRALAELGVMQAEIENDASSAVPKKGIFAMKFMQRGLQQQMDATMRRIQAAKERVKAGGDLDDDEDGELDGNDDEDYGMDDDDDEPVDPEVKRKKEVAAKKAAKKETLGGKGSGRMAFGPSGEDDEGDAQDDDDKEEEEKEVNEAAARSGAALGAQYQMRVSGPVSVNFNPKKGTIEAATAEPKLKPIFEVESFDGGEVLIQEFSPDNIHSIYLVDMEEDGTTFQLSRADFGKKASITAAKAAPPALPSKPTKAEIKAAKKASEKSKPAPVIINEVEEEDEDEGTYTAPNGVGADLESWLAPGTDRAKPTQKSQKMGVKGMSGLEQSVAAKGQVKVSAAQKKADREALKASDAKVVIDLSGVREMEKVATSVGPKGTTAGAAQKVPQRGEDATGVKAPAAKSQKKKQAAPAPVTYAPSDDDSDGDVEAPGLVHSSDFRNLSQRELMQMAFANDDVVGEFEEEKAKVIESEAPKEVDLTLPGWDANLKHVIINEKRLKKAAKYMATEVPFGFESREQYEQSIRQPVGKEWNAEGGHSRLTAPRIVTKMGTIIDPLKMKGSDSGKSKNGKGAKGAKGGLVRSSKKL
ncbi:hypothetical protein HDU76_005910 [Blyttiomyces sp. JEL0837]|nr:hypothetical protein HDU76_005910 [Blyttiomyces sp. JEL0837]